jgi:hypothetical protein
LDYEEGLLVDLSFCLAVAVSYVLDPKLARSPWRRSCMAVIAVALATAMYFTKTAALPALGAVSVLVLTRPFLGRIVKTTTVLTIALPLIFWGIHTWRTSGTVRLSSSWDGENMFRGNDSRTLALYPEISLDRAFDSTTATLDDGTVVKLGNYTRARCYADEWAWNDSYAIRALEWLTQNPSAATRFLAKKLWVGLVEVRHTPKYLSATAKQPARSKMVESAMDIWMLFARFVFCAFVVWALRPISRKTHTAGPWALALVAAFLAPCLLGFCYQRHLVPTLVMTGVLLSVVFLSRTPAKPTAAAAEPLP